MSEQYNRYAIRLFIFMNILTVFCIGLGFYAVFNAIGV